MNTQKTAARTFGVFFILAFFSYGLGSGLIESATSSTDILSGVYENQTQLIIGAILMALIHSFVNIGLPVVMLPILKPVNKRVTYGYLSAAIIATVTLVVGVIFLLMLLPLSNEYVNANSMSPAYYETLALILKKGGFFSYQIGMALWGLGGLMLCYLLYQSKLVPRLLSLWGFVGYLVFISGTILELFGNHIGVMLSLPGGLFEIFLSLWLIVKGFNFSNSKLIESSKLAS